MKKKKKKKKKKRDLRLRDYYYIISGGLNVYLYVSIYSKNIKLKLTYIFKHNMYTV